LAGASRQIVSALLPGASLDCAGVPNSKNPNSDSNMSVLDIEVALRNELLHIPLSETPAANKTFARS
jgi:hypothetical protein